MRRAIVLLCALARVGALTPAQRYFAARQARASAAPTGPRPLHGGAHTETVARLEEENLVDTSTERPKQTQSDKNSTSPSVRADKHLWPERGNASENLKFAPSTLIKSYDSVFRTDDEDLRTDFKNSYDIWPFFYHNLYEYEPKKLEVEAEKAIDKRFAVPTDEKVIPVHESVEETAHEDSESITSYGRDDKRTETVTTDNPNFGNQPFFSYVLNDYFDKADEDDPTTFKGITWAQEFDREMSLQDVDNAKRIRRLEENSPDNNKKKDANMFEGHDALHESSKSKGRDSRRESETSEKGDDSQHSYDGSYRYDGENYRGFKDFVDSFANRYGLEEHDRESNFAKKNNADKGEKKKGFRKVYHKDEYQEHHDFFDNTDNNENVEEKGTSKVHIGGSEGVLRSVAGAVTGDDEIKSRGAENIERKLYERNHEDKERYHGSDRELDQYRDVAKYTALSNNADYVDRYMT